MASLQVDVAKFFQAADHARSKLAVKKKHHKELLQNDKENRVVLKEQGKLRGEELRAHRERMETFENTLAERTWLLACILFALVFHTVRIGCKEKLEVLFIYGM